MNRRNSDNEPKQPWRIAPMSGKTATRLDTCLFIALLLVWSIAGAIFILERVL